MKARGYEVIENPSADQIYPGNPVIYKWSGSSYEWSHATICVGYDGNGTPIVNGHTGNVENVAWNYAQGRASKMCTALITQGNNAVTTGSNGISQEELSKLDEGAQSVYKMLGNPYLGVQGAYAQPSVSGGSVVQGQGGPVCWVQEFLCCS